MGRFFFVCYPDTNHPIGGVKQIYRQVSLLCSQGFDAYVLHKDDNFKVSWFHSDAPVISVNSFLASNPNPQTDLIVLPETWVNMIPSYLLGFKKVIFNQNAYYTFGLDGQFDSSILDLYRHPDVCGVVTVSDDNKRFLVDGCGLSNSTVFTVINAIDSSLFYPPPIKYKRIVYLDRKHSNHASAVVLMSKQRPFFNEYTFRPLGRLSHSEVASEMRDALVFLNCGHPEGFGLPLAEAIACGCIVIGYHGLAGRDFCKPALNTVDFGDLLAFVDTLMLELTQYNSNPSLYTSKLLSLSSAILTRYSLDQELATNISVWSRLIDSLCP